MQVGVTIRISKQVTEDRWVIERKTAIFYGSDELYKIHEWIKSINPSATISDAEINFIDKN